MSETMFRQCEMTQATERGFLRYVAWLPTDHARVGHLVRLDGEDGVWRVESVGPARTQTIVEAFAANARRGLPSVSGHERERGSST